jgi:hypothetical protein
MINNDQDVMSTIVKTLDQIINEAMEEIHHKSPYDWQRQVICHLFMMRVSSVNGVKPGACMCIQGTGGRKSAVRDTAGWINGGVTLTIGLKSGNLRITMDNLWLEINNKV